MPATAPPRSFLYVPGNRPEMFAKAEASGADAVILDLEDAVPATEVTSARAEVTSWLDRDHPAGPQWWVRLAPERLREDLHPILRPGLSGIVVAKVDRTALDTATTLLDHSAAGQVGVIGLVETAAAHVGLAGIASHPRLLTLGIGEVDLLADLGVTAGERTQHVIDGLRLEVVRQCAAAGLRPPVAPTSIDFRDLAAFRSSCELLRDLGFGARTAIHPNQLAVIHDVLTPTPDQVAAARDVLDRLERSEGSVALDAHGHLIDPAVARRARAILDRANVGRDHSA